MKRKVGKDYKRKARMSWQGQVLQGLRGPPGLEGKAGCSGTHIFSFHAELHLPKTQALVTAVNNTVCYI